MKVFLSYAHEQRPIAEEVSVSLSVRGYDVFIDRSSLKAGVEYGSAIEKDIEKCDLFIFLISPESLTQGTYTLTELGFAKSKWRNPSGRVLPVMARSLLNSKIDAYLRAVTILYPQGNLAAEVAARDVSYENLSALSNSLRDWYFSEAGGMFLSRTAHTSYAALQDSLAAFWSNSLPETLRTSITMQYASNAVLFGADCHAMWDRESDLPPLQQPVRLCG